MFRQLYQLNRAKKIGAHINGCHHRFYSMSNKHNVIVQKFGGTSLGSAEKMEKVINIIKTFNKDSGIIAVVSALSSHVKSEGTTSRLLAAAQSAVERKEFQQYLQLIEDTHFDIVYSLLSPGIIRDDIRMFIQRELSEIEEFCKSLSVIRELSPRSHDKIIGCGERLSAGLTSAILNDQGYNSTYINLSHHFDAIDSNKRGFQNEMKELLPKMDDLSNTIPVVTGFFGEVKDGIINSIGRGYSDFTAALYAGAVHAKALQVWKESDGVFTGNPTKIANAKLLSSVTPEEASELTNFGNEVLHPFTMRCAINDNIPIHILNTFNENGKGTMISPKTYNKYKLNKNGIIAVCSKQGVNIINCSITDTYEPLSNILSLFTNHNVKIDLLSTSVANVSVATNESTSMSNINNLMKDLERYGTVSLVTNRSIVSCIGSGMFKQVGIVAKILQSLSDQGINMEMISYPSSEIIVSVVINADQMDDAIKTIHQNYISSSTNSQFDNQIIIKQDIHQQQQSLQWKSL